MHKSLKTIIKFDFKLNYRVKLLSMILNKYAMNSDIITIKWIILIRGNSIFIYLLMQTVSFKHTEGNFRKLYILNITNAFGVIYCYETLVIIRNSSLILTD